MTKKDVITYFREIRKARDNNKLVIFVGAGVSKNSNLPSWSELVKELAEKIQYVPYIKNKETYKFSTDEYLKIPQYAFDKDPDDYYQTLTNILKVPTKSNSLNEMIIKLLPNHIITTNYDKLIENTDDLNNIQYKVVSSDKDLLISQGDHYIIKMHGDVEDLYNIVLKENDYLNYTNNHILIETFIKSLLVDHTFLFVGYSLNDYNLKQIMSWIDYLSSKESVSEFRHRNFIIQYGKPNEYEVEYWENKKLSIIDSSTLDKHLLEKYKQEDLREEVANSLYACLEIINDENADIFLTDYDEFLLESYSVFDSMENIYIDDLLSVSGIRKVRFDDGTLNFYEKETFEKWKSLQENKKICSYWKRAGIERLNDINNRKSNFLNLEDTELFGLDETVDKLFELLMNFKFESIEKVLKKENVAEHIKHYYEAQISMNNSEVLEYYFSSTVLNKSLSKFNSAIYKYNSFLLKRLSGNRMSSKDDVLRFIGMFSKQEKKAYNYLISIIQDGSDLKKLNQSYSLLTKTENSYYSPPLFTSHSFGELLKIRDKAYQHFLFIKGNGILLDNFSETKDFFEIYIKGMLITQKDIKHTEITLGADMSLKKYPLNLIDINIIVLFANYDNMKKYLIQENISRILYEESLDLVTLFENFCNTILYVIRKENYFLPQKFLNFSILLRHSELLNKDMERIMLAVDNLLMNKGFIDFMNKRSNIEKELLDLILNIIQREYELSIDTVWLLTKNLSIESIEGYQFSKIISYISRNDIYRRSRKIQLSISKTRQIRNLSKDKWLNFLVTMYPIMSDYMKKKYSKKLRINYLDIDSSKLVDIINMGIIHFDEGLKSKYIKQIKKAIDSEKSSFISHYPNTMEDAIEHLLVLYLLGKIDDVEFLREYASYFDYLEFIFFPQSFDYSLVDLDDYMWINFFRTNKYRKLMLEYGKDKLKAAAIKNLELGIASEDQKKIFYKYIADETDFWKYV
ncbi:SIR2 family protein [Enterococcus faecium]|uniref:SIR2 family protein n=1 Tax=Enterococcus faecium TaxID=1352 RepID=UPI00398F1147